MQENECRNPKTGGTPPGSPTVPPGRAEGLLADVYAGIADRSGYVAHILACQSLHPEALRDHYALYRT